MDASRSEPGTSRQEQPEVRPYLHFWHESVSHNRTETLVAAIQRGQSRFRPFQEDLPYMDSYCDCYRDRPRTNSCTCGENGKALEWVWDVDTKSNCTHLVNSNKDVRFHLHFSGGTAVIRGNRPITANQHYWEVKMTSLVYGTDMMVGIGTKDADIHKMSDRFCSILGIDAETWGFSYTGLFHHRGQSRTYSSGFGQGSIVGVHLDMWNGTLSFYKNRQPLGIACTGLKGKTLYPMVSSTAARSGMRIIHSVSFPSSLQFLCCVALRRMVAPDRSVLETLPLPPGMQVFLANNLGWLLGEDRYDDPNEETIQQSQNSDPQNIPKDPSTCSHQHLTCNGCNTPVFASYSNVSESVLLNDDSSDLVYLSGPAVLLENYNRFMPHSRSREHSESDTEDNESDTPLRSAVKKRKYSYNFAVGLSDDESPSDSDNMD